MIAFWRILQAEEKKERVALSKPYQIENRRAMQRFAAALRENQEPVQLLLPSVEIALAMKQGVGTLNWCSNDTGPNLCAGCSYPSPTGGKGRWESQE